MESVRDAIERLPLISFLWPTMLWLAVLIPLAAAAYLRADARRRYAGVQGPTLKPAVYAHRTAPGWQRHLPPVLMLLALTALILAVARPQARIVLPSRIETIMLVIDMSGSMRAKDIEPTRLRAAQLAAQRLVEAKPASVSVGLVSMAGTSAVARAPSRSKQEVITAIDRLQSQGGTALGNGVLIALTALRPQARPAAVRLMDGDATVLEELAFARRGADTEPEHDKPASAEAPDAIVVFSDGESNAGPTAVQAAQLAAAYGVRIHTVGVGTLEGVVLSAGGWSARVKLDETALKQMAQLSQGQYFRLQDAAQLPQVYKALDAKLTVGKTEQVEVSALLAALGAVLAIGGGLLSLWWFGRVA